MTNILLTLPWVASALIFTGLTTVCGMLLRAWIHRTVSKANLKRAHDVSATVYLNTGVLYGIVLGLVTVNGLDRHIGLQDAIEHEAALTLEIGRTADIFDYDHRAVIRNAARGYAEYVLNNEWSDDEHIGLRHDRVIDSLWNDLAVVLRADKDVSAAESFLMEKISDLVEARMLRIGLMREKISTMVWTILIGGGLLVVFFLVTFDPESTVVHAMLFAAAAVTIVTILILVFSFDHPTHGPLMVEPAPFNVVLEAIPPSR